MIFRETSLKDAYIIELDKREDERGFFARAWCRREFEDHGLVPLIVQSNLSQSARAGTLRGMHYQAPPFEESKVVQCIKGALYDVLIDLRPESPTFKKWVGIELTEENNRMAYVPKGFAHGFLTLKDNTRAFYHVSQFYSPGSERGIRWDDPEFAIEWPKINEFISSGGLVISDKDRNWPLWNASAGAAETRARSK
jgi:dTDP-4-dehydrorhamnose 3,5-epimerase